MKKTSILMTIGTILNEIECISINVLSMFKLILFKYTVRSLQWIPYYIGPLYITESVIFVAKLGIGNLSF